MSKLQLLSKDTACNNPLEPTNHADSESQLGSIPNRSRVPKCS